MPKKSTPEKVLNLKTVRNAKIEYVETLGEGGQGYGHKRFHACLHLPPLPHFADVLRGTRSAETHICDEPKHEPIAPP